MPRLGRALSLVPLIAALAPALVPAAAAQTNDIVVPAGYQVRQLASGFTSAIAASVAPNGDIYLLESGFPGLGGGLTPLPVKIWRVTPAGQASVVYSSDSQPGLQAVALGIAAKDPDTIFVNDGEGLKRVHQNGSVQTLIALPTFGDHAADHIAFGPDGKLYWGEGSATNSGVVGPDDFGLNGWPARFPERHDIPCRDVILSGVNYTSADPRTDGPGATAVTGAYMPFGTPAAPGQVVTGQLPCTSSVMRANPDGTGLEMVAWGFRNPFGVAFAPQDSVLKGSLVVANNGADVRGSRPIESDGDDIFVVKPGGWYGWPDYLDEQPVTEPRFAPEQGGVQPVLFSPNQAQAEGAVMHFEKGVSADGFAFSTSDAFGYKNDLFIALWGPLGFGAQPGNPPGFNVYRVHFEDQNGVFSGASKEIFAQNRQPGPAAQNGLTGLEHPVDVKFSPDGKVMYVVDFGVPGGAGTGTIWAVSR